MTPTDAASLLTVAAAFDNRKPDADAAKAWAFALEGLRFHDCRDAIVAHYQRTTDWIMPAHVITAVRKMRSSRLEDATDPTPPPELSPVETIAWLKDVRRRIADGETVDPDGAFGELTERHLPDLRELMPRVVHFVTPAPREIVIAVTQSPTEESA